MGGPQPGARDDEVMGLPEPAETETGVMGGFRWPIEVMRGRVRLAGLPYGTRRATDVMGGPGRPSDSGRLKQTATAAAAGCRERPRSRPL